MKVRLSSLKGRLEERGSYRIKAVLLSVTNNLKGSLHNSFYNCCTMYTLVQQSSLLEEGSQYEELDNARGWQSLRWARA